MSDIASTSSFEGGADEMTALAQRLREQSATTYSTLNGMTRSVTVANAAYVLAYLLASGASALLWAPFWVASFATLLVTYLRAEMSLMVLMYEVNWRDGAMPLLQALAEFMMFSTLMPSGKALPNLANWYLFAGLQALATSFLVSNLSARIEHAPHSPAAGDVIAIHAKCFRKDRNSSATVTVVWVLIWALMRFVAPTHAPILLQWQGIFGIVSSIIAVQIIREGEYVRRDTIRLIRPYLPGLGRAASR